MPLAVCEEPLARTGRCMRRWQHASKPAASLDPLVLLDLLLGSKQQWQSRLRPRLSSTNGVISAILRL